VQTAQKPYSTFTHDNASQSALPPQIVQIFDPGWNLVERPPRCLTIAQIRKLEFDVDVCSGKCNGTD